MQDNFCFFCNAIAGLIIVLLTLLASRRTLMKTVRLRGLMRNNHIYPIST